MLVTQEILFLATEMFLKYGKSFLLPEIMFLWWLDWKTQGTCEGSNLNNVTLFSQILMVRCEFIGYRILALMQNTPWCRIDLLQVARSGYGGRMRDLHA